MKHRFETLLTLSTAMIGDKHALTERIRFIGRQPKAVRLATVAVLVFAFLAAFISCTNAVEEQELHGCTLTSRKLRTPITYGSALGNHLCETLGLPDYADEFNDIYYNTGFLLDLDEDEGTLEGIEYMTYTDPKDASSTFIVLAGSDVIPHENAKHYPQDYDIGKMTAYFVRTEAPLSAELFDRLAQPGAPAELLLTLRTNHKDESGIVQSLYAGVCLLRLSPQGGTLAEPSAEVSARMAAQWTENTASSPAPDAQQQETEAPATQANAMEFAPDFTDPVAVSEAFLQRYFEKMLALDSDFGWDAAHEFCLGGTMAYPCVYAHQAALLMQWVSYKRMLFKVEGYRIASDVGRFTALESPKVDPSAMPAENPACRVSGYCRTTAFTTPAELLLTKTGAGTYAVISCDFPDWKEYHSFCSTFSEMMPMVGTTDYYGTAVIDALYEARLAERDAAGFNDWQDAERVEEPFAAHSSFIELPWYGACLNSNGTAPLEGQPAQYARSGKLGRSLLTVERFIPADGAAATPLAPIVNAQSGDTLCWLKGDRHFYDYESLDPTLFFGRETPVKALAHMNVRYEGKAYLLIGTYRQECNRAITTVGTVYLVQLYDAELGKDVLLSLYFPNAYEDWEMEGVMHLTQSEADCEAWLKTLTFA